MFDIFILIKTLRVFLFALIIMVKKVMVKSMTKYCRGTTINAIQKILREKQEVHGPHRSPEQ